MTVYRCVYLRYRSMEDWREFRDVLCRNSNRYSRPRYDCALVNTTDGADDLTVVRLCGLYCQCQLNGRGDEEDVALVKYFKKLSYKPHTMWRGCLAMEKEKDYEFMLLKHPLRGAHMIPVFNHPLSEPTNTFFFNDVVDNDMYIRATPELRDLYC